MSEQMKAEYQAAYSIAGDVEISVGGLREYLDECTPELFDEGVRHVVRGWINRIQYELNQLRRTVDGESEEGE